MMDHIITDPLRKRMLVSAVILANTVTMLNAGSANLAMPVFMSSFQATLNQVQWIMLGYVLSLACAMPLVSALCERFSHRKVFLRSLVAIGIFSLACAVSPNLWVLVFFRILCGFFSGLVVSASMALIYRYLPPAERAQQYASLLVIQSVAFAIGPSFAGLCMQLTGWQAIFILPVIFVVLSYWRARNALPVEVPIPGVQLHIFGVSMVSVATGILLIAFTFLEHWGITDLRFWGMILAAVVIIIWFIMNNRKNPHPSLDFSLFRLPSFALSIVLCLMLATIMGITASVLAVYVQGVRGFLPVYSGAVQLVPALLLAGANQVVKKIYGHVSATLLAAGGFLISAVGNALMLLVNMDLSLMVLSSILCIRYIGIGFIRMPISDYGMTAVSQDRVSHASALINWANQLSQAISTNLLTVLFTWRANVLFRAAGGEGVALAGKPGWAEANLGAFHLVFGTMAVLMLIGAILSLLMGPIGRYDKRKRAEKEEAKKMALVSS